MLRCVDLVLLELVCRTFIDSLSFLVRYQCEDGFGRVCASFIDSVMFLVRYRCEYYNTGRELNGYSGRALIPEKRFN